MGRKKTTAEFIEQAKIVHGDIYDYSKTEYVDSKTKVIIICSIHGEFSQYTYHHKNKHGCQLCGGITRANSS